MRFFPFPIFCLVFFLSSCKTQSIPLTNYLQQADTSATTYLNMAEPRIRKNDLLSIKVYSQSADPRTDLPYNLPEQTVGGSNSASGTGGFLVDETGFIEYPQLGRLQVEGMTKSELSQLIKEKLENVLKNPSVIVRFLNYRVTVLGEVRTPGTFTIPTERITILEALGMAGDITNFGNRDSVKVAREINGQLQLGSVKLTSSNLFSSPYFRLQQNDVIFVEQSVKRTVLEERQAVREQVGIVVGVITAIALIVNIIR